MRITKFGHACVRLEHDGTTLVLDPGGLHRRRCRRRGGRGADHPRAPGPLPARPPACRRRRDLHHRGRRRPDPRGRPRRRGARHGGRAGGGLHRRRAAGARRRRAARGDPPGPAPLRQQRVRRHARRDPGLPPRRRADRARRGGRRAVPAGLRALAQGVGGDRLRPLGGGAAQPRDPRPGLLRGRPRDRGRAPASGCCPRRGRRTPGWPTARTSSEPDPGRPQSSRSRRRPSCTSVHSGDERRARWCASTTASSRSRRTRPWRDRCTETRRRSVLDCWR